MTVGVVVIVGCEVEVAMAVAVGAGCVAVGVGVGVGVFSGTMTPIGFESITDALVAFILGKASGSKATVNWI